MNREPSCVPPSPNGFIFEALAGSRIFCIHVNRQRSCSGSIAKLKERGFLTHIRRRFPTGGEGLGSVDLVRGFLAHTRRRFLGFSYHVRRCPFLPRLLLPLLPRRCSFRSRRLPPQEPAAALPDPEQDGLAGALAGLPLASFVSVVPPVFLRELPRRARVGGRSVVNPRGHFGDGVEGVDREP